MRVPSVDPKQDKLIEHFEKKLAYFQSLTSHRREEEAADEAEATCRAMLSHLRGNNRTEAASTAQPLTLEEWLDQNDRETSQDD